MADNREDMDRTVPLPTTTEQRTAVNALDTDLTSDPADEIPVPIAMSPAEIDERAQAVEAVRGSAQPDPVVDELPNGDRP
jgi:hypothetical protein